MVRLLEKKATETSQTSKGKLFSLEEKYASLFWGQLTQTEMILPVFFDGYLTESTLCLVIVCPEFMKFWNVEDCRTPGSSRREAVPIFPAEIELYGSFFNICDKHVNFSLQTMLLFEWSPRQSSTPKQKWQCLTPTRKAPYVNSA